MSSTKTFVIGVNPRDVLVSRRAADITRAKEVLGWEPQTPFEKGLLETARWAKAEFAASMRAPELAAGA